MYIDAIIIIFKNLMFIPRLVIASIYMQYKNLVEISFKEVRNENVVYLPNSKTTAATFTKFYSYSL